MSDVTLQMDASDETLAAREPSAVLPLFPEDQYSSYPEFRYMGSKSKLVPWIRSTLSHLDFSTAADPFLGSGCVAYLLKTMGKAVRGSDFLKFPTVIARAAIENDAVRIGSATMRRLTSTRAKSPDFIQRTFDGVFFSAEDRRFLDMVCGNLERVDNEYERELARSALIRSCLKKQPRGVFTVSGDLSRYDDGRRDIRLSIEEHFCEQVEVMNAAVFSNGRRHRVWQGDAFQMDTKGLDLVYLDPPYVPRSDDNCYVKRYHFLEGLSCYWDGLEIMEETKVKKIRKKHTPFSYRKSAVEAFDRLFAHFQDCIIVLSYSSNGYPDLPVLEELMSRYKRHVVTNQKAHRYHFGTHEGVERAEVSEYLIVGT